MDRKFSNGQVVTAGYLKFQMIVLGAELCVRGWRYELGFPKKDGSLDKRRAKWFYFEDEITDEQKM